jgi:micrococcal nuclease
MVVVVVLVVSTGCISSVGTPEGGSTASPVDSPGRVDESLTVTVTDVVDGDTIDVEYANGTHDTVRLLGVDTPEVHTGTQPAEFAGVPDTTAGEQCLRRAGENASGYVTDQVAGESVRLIFDPESERRGYYGRLLAYVSVDGESLNHALVRAGHARVYDTEFTQRERYEEAAAAARSARRGLWSCVDREATATAEGTAAVETGPLSVVEINYDAAGNDNENLDDEYVVFQNTGSEPLDISGWTIADEAGHTFEFPDRTVIDPGAEVTLRPGSGTDTASTYYWGETGAVWNNDGDVVIVRNATGATVIRAPY